MYFCVEPSKLKQPNKKKHVTFFVALKIWFSVPLILPLPLQ